jgi:hypothetical protein
MTYRPTGSARFGPPLGETLPSAIYLVLALAVAAMVALGSVARTGSWLFRYVVEQDAHRVLGARPLAAILVASAVAAVLRARMRGVLVHPEGVEARDALAGGWPRVRRFAWPQIDRIVLDGDGAIALDLWDGTRAWLPLVSDREGLARALERVALARAIPVSGGTGEIDDAG